MKPAKAPTLHAGYWDGEQAACMVKGDLSDEEALTLAATEMGGINGLEVEPSKWWRIVPTSGEYDHRWVPAAGPGRGAFQARIVYDPA